MNTLISVIVPVYCVEQYLDRCVKSIVCQTYDNLEIILVDDGSPDNCPEICNKWAQADVRIKVIHKQNAGLGYARNSGMDIATGDAIAFVDSDDFLLPTAIEKSYMVMRNETADIVCFGFQKVNFKGCVYKRVIPTPISWNYSGTQVQAEFLPNFISADPKTGYNFHIEMNAWSALFSRKIVEENHWRFVSERDIISEDTYSLLSLYKDIEKVVILPDMLYCYCENAGSLTHRYRVDRYAKIVEFYNKSISLCEKCGYGNCVKDRLKRPFLAFSLATMKMIQQSTLGPKAKKDELRKICSDTVMCDVLQNYTSKADSTAFRLFWIAVKHKKIRTVSLMLKIKNAFDNHLYFIGKSR